jgi:hypothetical protein
VKVDGIGEVDGDGENKEEKMEVLYKEMNKEEYR